MNPSAKRQPYHLLAAAGSFFLGAALLLFVPDDNWWRTSGGGIIYVFFLYVSLRYIWPSGSPYSVAFLIALFASVVEMLQAFGLTAHLARLNLFAEALFGTTFQWTDFAGYAGGLVLALASENLFTWGPLQPPE